MALFNKKFLRKGLTAEDVQGMTEEEMIRADIHGIRKQIDALTTPEAMARSREWERAKKRWRGTGTQT